MMNSIQISGLKGEDDIRDYFLEITDGRSVSKNAISAANKFIDKLLCGYQISDLVIIVIHSYGSETLDFESLLRNFRAHNHS